MSVNATEDISKLEGETKTETTNTSVESEVVDGVSPELREKWTNAGKEENKDDTGNDTTPSESSQQEESSESVTDAGESQNQTETDVSGDTTESQGIEVPERLVQAGRRAEMSDEAIVEFATNKPEILEQLAKAQDKLSAEFGEVGRQRQALQQQEKPAVKDDKADEPFKIDLDDDFDPDTKEKIVEPLVKEINRLRDAAKANTDSTQASQDVQIQSTMKAIDTCFDARTENHPQLGNSESLTAEQQEMRVDILTLAEQKANRHDATHPDDLLSMDRAIDMALGMLKTNDNTAEQKIVKKLNANQKLFTSRPTSHQKSAPPVKDEDKSVNAVKQYAEAHDIGNLK